MNLHIDPAEFREVIDAAVDTAIRRHMDTQPRELPADSTAEASQ